ncbi:MAG TPA: hypothetical protein VGI80_06105, partial [Pyrinomonadaceae bacterium]
MQRILAKGVAAGVTFLIGVICSYAVCGTLTMWTTFLSSDQYRSFQIKWIGTDGHAVWTPYSSSTASSV